jgi:hypothetical protein
MSKVIMGVSLQQRIETAKAVQELLTKYGCSIQTRLGLHQTSKDLCSQKGLIILEFADDADDEAIEMEKELLKIENVIVKKMEF